MSHTTFAPQIGHEHIQQKILHSVDHNRLSHAYLFYGPEGTGKDAFAISLAQLLNCGLSNGELDCESPQAIKIANLQHPDLKFVFPTPAQSALKEEDLVEALQEKARNPYQRLTFSGKNTFIGIDTIRELKREARFKLYEGKKKVFIISEADKMRVEAANALLKLLEEPPHNLMLILTTANIYKILPTIKSRCQLIKFSQLPQEKMETLLRQYGPDSDQRALSIIIRLSGGNIKKAFYFLEKDILQVREQAIELLRKVVVIERAQELLEIVEPIAAQKDREQARLLLWFLLLWFQDILHIQKTQIDEHHLRNTDKAETLQKFFSFSPRANVEAIVFDIEAALQHLADQRNFNPLLILTNLAIKLNLLLKG